MIDGRDAGYFARSEAAIGRPIPPRKRAWYVRKRDSEFGGDDAAMWSQYPTTLNEAFTVSTDGLWLAPQMSRARTDARIGAVPYVPGLPVVTVWDLGISDDMAIWLGQEHPTETHWIDYIEGSGEPYSWYVREIMARGYVLGRTVLPHDAAHRHQGAHILKTPEDMVRDLGMRETIIVPRVSSLVAGIEHLRDAFPTYRFDETRCAAGIKHLDQYAKVWNERMGVWSDTPLRNGHQHAADALRQHAQMRAELRRPSNNAPRRRSVSGMAV